MKTGVHQVDIKVYGSDWARHERLFMISENELLEYESGEYTRKELAVNGIDGVEVEVERNISTDAALERMTVADFAALFTGDGHTLKTYARIILEGGSL